MKRAMRASRVASSAIMRLPGAQFFFASCPWKNFAIQVAIRRQSEAIRMGVRQFGGFLLQFWAPECEEIERKAAIQHPNR